MALEFTAVFRQVPEGYIGFVEELPGANTQGVTLEEARANLHEAVAMVLEANRELAQQATGKGPVIASHSRSMREAACACAPSGAERLSVTQGRWQPFDIRRSDRHNIDCSTAHGINDDLAKKICKDLGIPEP